MADNDSQRTDTPKDTASDSARQAVDRLLARGIQRRWAILWERAWPPLATLVTLAGLFFVLSWLGLWLWLPPLGRVAGVILFGLATLAALWPFVSLRMPSVEEGLARLDRRSGIAHRPAIALTDRLASNSSDPMTQALWRAHVERALAAARALRAGWPTPRLWLRDPVAVRALVLVLFVATFFAAEGVRERRIAAAFDWRGVVTRANYRIDAWVTPPPYTARPPVILPALRRGGAGGCRAARRANRLGAGGPRQWSHGAEDRPDRRHQRRGSAGGGCAERR